MNDSFFLWREGERWWVGVGGFGGGKGVYKTKHGIYISEFFLNSYKLTNLQISMKQITEICLRFLLHRKSKSSFSQFPQFCNISFLFDLRKSRFYLFQFFHQFVSVWVVQDSRAVMQVIFISFERNENDLHRRNLIYILFFSLRFLLSLQINMNI